MGPAVSLALMLFSLAGGRVLPPSVAAYLEQTAAPLGPAIELREATCRADSIQATFCASSPDGSCVTLTLTDPDAGCLSAPAGPWCVTPAATTLDPGHVDAIRAALAGMVSPYPWVEPAAAPRSSDSPLVDRPLWQVALLALAVLLVPLFLGVGAGRLLRRARRPFAPVVGGALVLLVVAAVLVLVPGLPHVGAWDQAFVALVFLASLGLGAALPRGVEARRPVLALGLGLVVGAVLLEGVARATFGAPPRPLGPIDETQLLARPEELEGVCRVLFPDDDPVWSLERKAVATAEKVVLHVGDSMTGGSWVDASTRFATLLEGRDRRLRHISLGAGGAGVDTYARVVSTWKGSNVAAVVVHVFPGNDLLDLDRPLICCDDGPLFAWEGDGPRVRCPRPAWRFDRRTLFARAPAPLPLRLLARVSSAAALATLQLDRARLALMPLWAPGGEGTDEGSPQVWGRFRVLFGEMRDDLAADRIPLLVVVLPFRGALASKEPRETPSWRVRGRMLDELASLSIPALDAWPPFVDATRDGPTSDWFVTPPPYDCHFNERGHALYAYWLRDQLDAFLTR